MEGKRRILIDKILKLAREGAFSETGRLPSEREFAHQLGVSRNLLREALVTLEGMGFLDIRGREGIYLQERESYNPFAETLKNVTIWPEDMMDQLMEMRRLIEIPAAELAAERRTDEDLIKLERCIDELKRISASPNDGDGATWDSLLHMAVMNCAKNHLMSRVFEGLTAVMERYIGDTRRSLFAHPELPQEVLDQHIELVKSIKARDKKGAREIMVKHLDIADRLFKQPTGTPQR